jgi:hypothetical protein
MNDHEVTVILTKKRIKLYERAIVLGVPEIVISMYGDSIQKLLDDEREACAVACEEWGKTVGIETWDMAGKDCADAIRARGTHD